MKDWQKVREEFDHGNLFEDVGALCAEVVRLRSDNKRLAEQAAENFSRAVDAQEETARTCAKIVRESSDTIAASDDILSRYGLEEL
jgi:hypothetical protein